MSSVLNSLCADATYLRLRSIRLTTESNTLSNYIFTGPAATFHLRAISTINDRRERHDLQTSSRLCKKTHMIISSTPASIPHHLTAENDCTHKLNLRYTAPSICQSHTLPPPSHGRPPLRDTLLMPFISAILKSLCRDIRYSRVGLILLYR
jgi:hypothetical protein